MDKVKVLGDLLGIGFHVADYYTDLATTKLYWDNCQFKFFSISIGIFVYSYVANVLYHLCFTEEKSIYRALLYPYNVLKILFKKIMIGLKSKYMLQIDYFWSKHVSKIFLAGLIELIIETFFIFSHKNGSMKNLQKKKRMTSISAILSWPTCSLKLVSNSTSTHGFWNPMGLRIQFSL